MMAFSTYSPDFITKLIVQILELVKTKDVIAIMERLSKLKQLGKLSDLSCQFDEHGNSFLHLAVLHHDVLDIKNKQMEEAEKENFESKLEKKAKKPLFVLENKNGLFAQFPTINDCINYLVPLAAASLFFTPPASTPAPAPDPAVTSRQQVPNVLN
jgi:hypothetical protein